MGEVVVKFSFILLMLVLWGFVQGVLMSVIAEGKGWGYTQWAQSGQPFAFYHKPSGRVWNWKTMKPMEQRGLKWVDVDTAPDDQITRELEKSYIKQWQPVPIPTLESTQNECLFQRLQRHPHANTLQIAAIERQCKEEAQEKIEEVRKHNAAIEAVEYWPHDGVSQLEDNGQVLRRTTAGTRTASAEAVYQRLQPEVGEGIIPGRIYSIRKGVEEGYGSTESGAGNDTGTATYERVHSLYDSTEDME